jgi:hypothetical protein
MASKTKSKVRVVVFPAEFELRRFEGGSLMNRILIAAFTTALLCGSLLAQTQQPPSSESSPQQPQTTPSAEPSASPSTPTEPQTSPSAEPPAAPSAPAQATPASASANQAPRIAPGSVIPARLTKGINAKKAKKGDEVVATVTQDLRNNAGTVLVPKDTKIVGHVTEAQASSKQQKESQVAIAFDRAVPKSGEPMQMPMSIQAIIAPPNPNQASANAQPSSGYPGSETGGVPPSSSGRQGQGSMGGGTPPAPQTSGNAPSGAPAGAQAQPQITGNTQGVVGIENLKLSAAPDATQGSVVSSEKGNVKLDDGTFLLLRVNQ